MTHCAICHTNDKARGPRMGARVVLTNVQPPLAIPVWIHFDCYRDAVIKDLDQQEQAHTTQLQETG